MVFNKLKYNFQDYDYEPALPAVNPGSVPTQRQIYQSRQQFGVNLGSIFILEKFIHDSFFIEDTNAELEAITAQVKQSGTDKTRQALEEHWTTFINDDDWAWLQSVGVTSVRVPVGYWEIDGGRFADNTPFEHIASVYKNAWKIYKLHYIEKAAQHNISVLVDIHALPGGANTGDHSGQTLSEPGFWGSSKYQLCALDAIKFLADDLKQYDNIAGLQVVNESVYDDPGTAQSKYYKAAIHKIRKRNQEIPIVISDGWNPNQWVEWVKQGEQQLNNADLGVILDVHIYRCFSDDDKNKDPDTIINELESTVLNDVNGQADVIVGEYSAVLDGDTWNKLQGDRGQKVSEYASTEIRLFNQRASGSYFWTYKFQHGDGGEWGFVPMVNSGALPKRPTAPTNFPSAEERDQVLQQKLDEHSNYWNGANPNEQYEHGRYADAFYIGWNDAAEFAKFDGSTIGRKHSWKVARRNEHIQQKGASPFLWEWDSGFDAGVKAFEELAGLVQ